MRQNLERLGSGLSDLDPRIEEADRRIQAFIDDRPIPATEPVVRR
jgi:hypothetical protein